MKTIAIIGRILRVVKKVISVALEYEKLTGRKLGITGEVGEILGCEKLGLELLVDRQFPGYDAIKNRKTYQIKSRRVRGNLGKVGRFSKYKFDYATLVVFNWNYSIDKIYRATYKKLKPILDISPNRNPSFIEFKRISEVVYGKE